MNDELQQPEKAQLAQLKLERFVQRFEPAHRDLALHASLPLILTPELVNHLRAEFLLDSVGWVAEADLLLSDLCREIGYEMYLMDRDVRALLREALQRDERFGPERMRQIARRVYDYLAYLAETDPILRPEDLQSQRWTAMFYLDDATRREAAAEMVEAINRCLEMSPAELAASGGAVNWAELARFAHLIRQMTEQLRGDYDDLIEYAALARQVAAARLGEIPLSQLQPGELAREFEVAGKKLARLDWLIGEIERERARNQPKPKARVATGSLLVGEVVVATVEKADFLCVIVNLGSGAQGVAPVTDFLANDGSIAAKQGDSADVIITDPPDDGSRFGVSRVAALRPQDWAGIASAHKRGQCVVGRLTDLTKHGGQVEIAGFRAFLPIKEFDYSRARYSKSSEQRYFKSREQWIGKEIAVRITECDRAGYHLRVSRLAALNTEAELRRERTLAGLEESVVVEGRVKRLLDYGAFVDLGGFDGLLHKSEMSWARFDHPRELFREDERIAVKVLDVDRERKRVSLSRRQLLPDPWETAPERYSIGDRVAGAVVHLADFGAFVELEPGVEALVHASDISRERRVKHPGEALKKGQQIEAVIVSLNVEKRKIGLSIKDLTQPSTQPEIVRITLTTFDFRTIKLDERGKVIEDRVKQARCYVEELDPDVDLEMVEIPGGKFLMGTSDEDFEKVRKEYGRYQWNPDWIKREMPQREVTVPPFYIGKFAVTQRQWRIVAGWEKVERDLEPDPSRFKDSKDSDDRPVEQVSWLDAVEFCARLSRETGKHYRLPTEAEWEYACRAGTTTPFAFGETITDEFVNYNSEYPYAKVKKAKPRNETVPAGSLGVANGFGLYDMHGNVWEWCEDQWHNSYDGAPTDGSAWVDISGRALFRVNRGGRWDGSAAYCRSAFRYHYSPDDRGHNLGFRLSMTYR